MKITLSHYDETMSIEHERDDLKIEEVVDMFERLIRAAGFSGKTRLEYSIDGEEAI